MDLRTANLKMSQLENEREFLLKKKELEFEKTQPKSPMIENSKVDTSKKREDKFAKYVFKVKEIDDKIDEIDKEVSILNEYIVKEMKILNTYGKSRELVITLRETTNLKWREIARETHFSTDHCKTIYRIYKRQRDIEKD